MEGKETYEWNPTVAADGNLWLVGIDEDLGMAQGSSTTITGDDFVVGPPYRLLVNQFDGGVGLGLTKPIVSILQIESFVALFHHFATI